MYCVKLLGLLRVKFGFLTAGNSEGFREQARERRFSQQRSHTRSCQLRLQSESPAADARQLQVRGHSRDSRALTSPSQSFSGAL